MRFSKLSKILCVIAGCVLVGTAPVYADRINYSEILSPGSSFDMSDLEDNASEYSWAVSGNTSSGTMVGPDGTLLIGSDEEAETVTVAATLLQDAGTTNQYYIKVDPSVSKVSSEHASGVTEPAHHAKQAGTKEEKKKEIDFSGIDQVISAYKNLDTSACQKSDISLMDGYVSMAKQMKGFDSVSQDQVDACANRLSYAYKILEQEAYDALPFYEKYMSQIVIGAAAAIGAVILLAVLLHILRKVKMERDPEYAERLRAQEERKRMQKQQKNAGMRQRTKRRHAPAAHPAESASGRRNYEPGASSRTGRTQAGPASQWGGNSGGIYPEADTVRDEATTLLSEDPGEEEETSLLVSGTTGVLVSQETKEEFYITKMETVIGKERKKVDICIANDPTVSRRHCCITRQNGEFYLSDMGSSNGTYFGGKRLTPGRPARLRDGDRFTISDQTFLFHVNEG